MYQYYSEVEDLIKELAEIYNIAEKNINNFYKPRINKFFIDYMGQSIHREKPLNAITYFDVNTFLKNLISSDAEKSNCYSALKRFFEYSYLKGKTKEIISNVIKPEYERKPVETLKEEDYLNIKRFIVNREKMNLNERLILGLFLFTGLSRKYIANLRNNQFVYEDGVYKLVVWKDEEEVILPLKAELQILIHEYCGSLTEDSALAKVMQMNENYTSTYIGDLTNRIIGKRCTPTIFSNTFIAKALSNGNNIWEVSRLTLESVTTIEQHVKGIENSYNLQTSILNSF